MSDKRISKSIVAMAYWIAFFVIILILSSDILQNDKVNFIEKLGLIVSEYFLLFLAAGIVYFVKIRTIGDSHQKGDRHDIFHPICVLGEQVPPHTYGICFLSLVLFFARIADKQNQPLRGLALRA